MGMEWVGWDGMGWDGMGWDGMGADLRTISQDMCRRRLFGHWIA